MTKSGNKGNTRRGRLKAGSNPACFKNKPTAAGYRKHGRKSREKSSEGLFAGRSQADGGKFTADVMTITGGFDTRTCKR